MIDFRSQSDCFCGVSILLDPAAVLTTTLEAAAGALSTPDWCSVPQPDSAHSGSGRRGVMHIEVVVGFYGTAATDRFLTPVTPDAATNIL